jgi:APA family basic amino acid/polyamine antiporter
LTEGPPTGSGAAPTTDEGLIRAIGPWSLGANVMNMVIGAGIFVLPGVVAAQLGSAAIVAYAACALIVALVFLCYTEVGCRITRSGGSYAYVEEAFGPFAGSVTSTLLWLGFSVCSDAALAVALTDALAKIIPILQQPMVRVAFLVALFASLAAINIVGIQAGLRVLAVSTLAKLAPLVLLAIAGLFTLNPEFLRITEWPSLATFGATTLVLFFAFGGAETALSCGGEIKDPMRTVPRGLFLGVSGILLLYVILQVVAQGNLGPELASNTEAPLAASATRVFGNWGAQMLMLGMVVSVFSLMLGDMLNTPRVIFAAARDGLLPRPMSKVHARFRTPHVAILFYATTGCLFALSGTFRQLAVMAAGSILLVYLGVSLSVIRLRQKHGMPAPGQFRIPGGPVIPLLSAAVVLLLLTQLSTGEALGLGGLLLFAVVVYASRGVFGQR